MAIKIQRYIGLIYGIRQYCFHILKMKILILENCMEEPPELKPNDWKVIRTQLLGECKKRGSSAREFLLWNYW